MIGYLIGKIVDLTPASLYLEVNGVGYDIQISLNTYDAIKDKDSCKLFTYIQVREDAWTMYGFAIPEEKECFLKLTSVSGVGAATARLLLSGLTPNELATIVMSGDNKSLEKIKGIGSKTAQRIILELKGKIDFETIDDNQKGSNKHNTLYEDALHALIGLGISKSMAQTALSKVAKSTDIQQLSIENLIKLALKNI